MHRHPGEEFAYVVEGGIHDWQHGTDGERHMPAGSFAKLVVSRVHTPGSPERELVDIDA